MNHWTQLTLTRRAALLTVLAWPHVRKAGAGADYFEASIIDTRLRAVEELLREQLRDKTINK